MFRSVAVIGKVRRKQGLINLIICENQSGMTVGI